MEKVKLPGFNEFRQQGKDAFLDDLVTALHDARWNQELRCLTFAMRFPYTWPAIDRVEFGKEMFSKGGFLSQQITLFFTAT
jgi:hypothetical protein